MIGARGGFGGVSWECEDDGTLESDGRTWFRFLSPSDKVALTRHPMNWNSSMNSSMMEGIFSYAFILLPARCLHAAQCWSERPTAP
jgi:hypothetical protein